MRNVYWEQKSNRLDVRLPVEPRIGQAWEESEEFGAAALRDELWDVFVLDDETAEPEPQYGDFWAEPPDRLSV